MSNPNEIPEEGSRVKFLDKGCFVCGQSNPIGLHLEFQYDPDKKRATSRIIFKDEHQGWDGIVHGGILAAILDDAMAHAILTTNNLAITTHMSLTYREAVLVGEEIILEGVVTELRPRVAKTHGIVYGPSAEGSDEMVIKCEADGTYFLDAPCEVSEPC
jgi:acyl-coenzyme A thioesterase PaaI-like protein